MIKMPRPSGTKNIQVEKTTEIEELERKLQEAKQAQRKAQHTKEARQTLQNIKDTFQSNAQTASSLDDIYNLAKSIFFQVNGARRILKNADNESD